MGAVQTRVSGSVNAIPLVFGVSWGITNSGKPCQVPWDPRDRQTLELPAKLKKPTHLYPAPWRLKAESFQEAEVTRLAGGSGKGWGTWRMLAACPPGQQEATLRVCCVLINNKHTCRTDTTSAGRGRGSRSSMAHSRDLRAQTEHRTASRGKSRTGVSCSRITSGDEETGLRAHLQSLE